MLSKENGTIEYEPSGRTTIVGNGVEFERKVLKEAISKLEKSGKDGINGYNGESGKNSSKTTCNEDGSPYVCGERTS